MKTNTLPLLAFLAFVSACSGSAFQSSGSQEGTPTAKDEKKAGEDDETIDDAASPTNVAGAYLSECGAASASVVGCRIVDAKTKTIAKTRRVTRVEATLRDAGIVASKIKEAPDLDEWHVLIDEARVTPAELASFRITHTDLDGDDERSTAGVYAADGSDIGSDEGSDTGSDESSGTGSDTGVNSGSASAPAPPKPTVDVYRTCTHFTSSVPVSVDIDAHRLVTGEDKATYSLCPSTPLFKTFAPVGNGCADGFVVLREVTFQHVNGLDVYRYGPESLTTTLNEHTDTNRFFCVATEGEGLVALHFEHHVTWGDIFSWIAPGDVPARDAGAYTPHSSDCMGCLVGKP